jgi:hypothetical protein
MRAMAQGRVSRVRAGIQDFPFDCPQAGSSLRLKNGYAQDVAPKKISYSVLQLNHYVPICLTVGGGGETRHNSRRSFRSGYSSFVAGEDLSTRTSVEPHLV